MYKFNISKTLKNGLLIELYTDTYGINYCITVFSPGYKAIETRKTKDYFNALNLLTIMENKYNKQ